MNSPLVPEPPGPLDLWRAINTAIRLNSVPANVMPGAIDIHLFMGSTPCGVLHVPLFPPQAEPQPIGSQLTPAQERILQELAESPKTATKLRVIEPNLYRRGAGLAEMKAAGLIVSSGGKWQLTDFGWDYCHEHGLAPDEE